MVKSDPHSVSVIGYKKPNLRFREGNPGTHSWIIELPYFAVYNAHQHFRLHYAWDYHAHVYAHGM